MKTLDEERFAAIRAFIDDYYMTNRKSPTVRDIAAGTGILRTHDDSMIEAGIEDGDMVVVKKTNVATPGDKIVALIENETTLKTFYPEPEKRRIRLHPENSKMKDIIVKDCNIQGVACHVIKKI